MKKNIRVSILLWVLAFILTSAIFVHQRVTGPTYPLKGKETFKGREISYFLLRSYTQFQEMPVRINVPDQTVTAFLNYKRYKTDDEWTEVEMRREGATLLAGIPGQPAAGKVEYSIHVNIEGETFILNQGRSMIVRFKGAVPTIFLLAHIIFMAFGIMFALRTCMEALRKDGNYSGMVNWTVAIVFIGGMIFGPIVQKYAFGDFWTGFPWGFDLTDNKVLIAVLCWIAAFFLKKKSKWWVVAASVVMIVVYLIPHSAQGSELDYSTGKMKNKYTLAVKIATRTPRIYRPLAG